MLSPANSCFALRTAGLSATGGFATEGSRTRCRRGPSPEASPSKERRGCSPLSVLCTACTVQPDKRASARQSSFQNSNNGAGGLSATLPLNSSREADPSTPPTLPLSQQFSDLSGLVLGCNSKMAVSQEKITVYNLAGKPFPVLSLLCSRNPPPLSSSLPPYPPH